MNTSIMREAALDDVIALKTEEKIVAIVLNVEELAQVSGGKVNEYEGQHSVSR
jgi:bacteriocin-like protein